MAPRRSFAAITLLPIAAISWKGAARDRATPPPRRHPAAHASARHTTLSLLGDGIGLARFGASPGALSADLDAVFGPPARRRPTPLELDCNVSASLTWPTLTAYLRDGHFVGYGYTTYTGYGYGNGDAQRRADAGSAHTAAGLEVGESVVTARRIYGPTFRTSTAQSGSWSATTRQGTLLGYLTVPVATRGHPARIATIGAGDVGCPAMSP